MSLLMDKTLRDFNAILTSKEPAPGGGSASALAGLMGTSLTMMVVNLSIGRKNYEALDESIKHAIEANFLTVKVLSKDLAELVDEDTKAFNQYMEALRLPKESEEDKTKRSAAIQKAGLYALEIPLLVAEKSLMLLRCQKIIALHGNKNAVSDLGVGALFASTSLEGAALNVKINLQGIDEDSFKSEVKKKIEAYLSEGNQLKQEILDIVDSRIMNE